MGRNMASIRTKQNEIKGDADPPELLKNFQTRQNFKRRNYNEDGEVEKTCFRILEGSRLI